MISSTAEMAAKTMQENRAKFEAFCRSLSEEELLRPVPNSDWRVKDFIIHLCQFDAEMGRAMDALQRGDVQATSTNEDGTPFDVDAYNNAQVHKRHNWTLDEILAEGAETRAQLLKTMSTMSDEHIDQVFHFPGDNKRPGADVAYKVFLFGLARHDPVHVADMVKALPDRAADPDMVAWLDDRAVQWYQQAMSGPPAR